MRQTAVVLGVLALALALSAQGRGKGKEKPPGDARQDSTAVSVSVVFGDSDERIIREWVEATPAHRLPRGLARRGDLPPGLQKQLHRNGTLPPGLEKRISPFPRQLTRRLGPLPAGCRCDRRFLDGKALIVERATGAILDVIELF